MAWAVLVIWNDGEEEYLKQGRGSRVALFPSRSLAQNQADFMREGMDDVQSINVVAAPRDAKRKPARKASPSPSPAPPRAPEEP